MTQLDELIYIYQKKMKKMIQVLLLSAVMFSPSFLNHAAVNAEERHSVPENSSMVSYGKLCNCGVERQIKYT